MDSTLGASRDTPADTSRSGSTGPPSSAAAESSGLKDDGFRLRERRRLVTVYFPIDMGCYAKILRAVADAYPEAVVGEAGEVWDGPHHPRRNINQEERRR